MQTNQGRVKTALWDIGLGLIGSIIVFPSRQCRGNREGISCALNKMRNPATCRFLMRFPQSYVSLKENKFVILHSGASDDGFLHREVRRK